MAIDNTARAMAAKALQNPGGGGSGSTVTKSQNNGYINVDGFDVEVYNDSDVRQDIDDNMGDIAALQYDTAIDRAALVAAINAGQKNLVDTSKCENRTTSSGIIIENNNDGSLTLKGANSSDSEHLLYANINRGITGNNTNQIVGHDLDPRTEYVCFCDGLSSTLLIDICGSNDQNGLSSINVAVSADKDLTLFKIPWDYKYIWFRLRVNIRADFGDEGITIRPMICKKKSTGISHRITNVMRCPIES